MILHAPRHSYQTGDTFTAATVAGDTLIIANTRNEESASEGNYMNLVTVIPLVEAIKIAKMVLATQLQAVTEDDKFDAFMDRQYQAWLDHKSLVDDALEHEIRF